MCTTMPTVAAGISTHIPVLQQQLLHLCSGLEALHLLHTHRWGRRGEGTPPNMHGSHTPHEHCETCTRTPQLCTDRDTHMYALTHAHTHTHMHARNTHMHKCTHDTTTPMYRHTYAQHTHARTAPTHTHTHVYTHPPTHPQMYTHTHTYRVPQLPVVTLSSASRSILLRYILVISLPSTLISALKRTLSAPEEGEWEWEWQCESN